MTLMLLGLLFLLSHSDHAFAYEGKEHDENMVSMRAIQQTVTTTSQAVEVGNTMCPVSGSKVNDGKMGEAVTYEYHGKIYNLCCKMCIKDFKKDPEKYSKIAEKEVAKEKAK